MRGFARRLRGGAGFSIPELLGVLAVIGGIVIVGSLRLARDPAARARVASHQLAFAFRLARARAVALHHSVYVDFAPAPLTPADGVYTAFADLDDDHAEDPGERDAAQLVLDTARDGLVVKALPRSIRFGAPPDLTTGPGNTSIFDDGVSFSGGQNKIGFYPTGGSSAGTVYLTAAGEPPSTWAVRTNISGSVETWSWDGDQWRRRS